MPRKLFDRELTELIEEMTNLGNTVDERIEQTIDVLRTLNLEKAAEIAKTDGIIDQKEHKIEKMCKINVRYVAVA